MNDTPEVTFRFNSSAPGVGPETFHLIRLSGFEAISELYEFTVDLASDEADIDPANMIMKRAAVEIQQAGEVSLIHGVVSTFELLGRDKAWVHYRAVVVPGLWLLGRTFQSQIFLEKDVKKIVEDVLKESDLKPDDDFSISLSGTYPQLEYTVQYEETDLAFVRRMLEHYGIFFYFEHGEKKEKLVIRDAKDAHPKIREDYVIPFREPSGLVHGEEAVTQLSYRQRIVTKSVNLKDYNYRKPSLEVKGEATAAAKGFGSLIEYGNHFKDPEEGKALAKVRGEEIACREDIRWPKHLLPLQVGTQVQAGGPLRRVEQRGNAPDGGAARRRAAGSSRGGRGREHVGARVRQRVPSHPVRDAVSPRAGDPETAHQRRHARHDRLRQLGPIRGDRRPGPLQGQAPL